MQASQTQGYWTTSMKPRVVLVLFELCSIRIIYATFQDHIIYWDSTETRLNMNNDINLEDNLRLRVHEGDNIIFRCRPTGYGTEQLFWTLNKRLFDKCPHGNRSDMIRLFDCRQSTETPEFILKVAQFSEIQSNPTFYPGQTVYFVGQAEVCVRSNLRLAVELIDPFTGNLSHTSVSSLREAMLGVSPSGNSNQKPSGDAVPPSDGANEQRSGNRNSNGIPLGGLSPLSTEDIWRRYRFLLIPSLLSLLTLFGVLGVICVLYRRPRRHSQSPPNSARPCPCFPCGSSSKICPHRPSNPIENNSNSHYQTIQPSRSLLAKSKKRTIAKDRPQLIWESLETSEPTPAVNEIQDVGSPKRKLNARFELRQPIDRTGIGAMPQHLFGNIPWESKYPISSKYKQSTRAWETVNSHKSVKPSPINGESSFHPSHSNHTGNLPMTSHKHVIHAVRFIPTVVSQSSVSITTASTQGVVPEGGGGGDHVPVVCTSPSSMAYIVPYHQSIEKGSVDVQWTKAGNVLNITV